MFSKLVILFVSALSLWATNVSVTLFTPSQNKSAITLSAIGKVESSNNISVIAKSSGVLHLAVANNSFVTKGSVIATLSSEKRDKKLQFLQKKLLLQKGEADSFREKLKRSQEKYKMGVGSKNSYLSDKIALMQLREALQSTKNEYEILQLEKKNATILAKKSATLTQLAGENSFINYGEKIATLLDTNNYVKLFVASEYASQIKKGMQVSLQSSYKNSSAKVINIVPKTSQNLIEVIVKPKQKLPLNLQLNATIQLKTLKGLLIPKEAIVLVQNHPAVYLVDEKNIAHLFFIEIQKDMIQNALIKNTLPKKSKIALKNAYMLHDNLKVSVK